MAERHRTPLRPAAERRQSIKSPRAFVRAETRHESARAKVGEPRDRPRHTGRIFEHAGLNTRAWTCGPKRKELGLELVDLNRHKERPGTGVGAKDRACNPRSEPRGGLRLVGHLLTSRTTT